MGVLHPHFFPYITYSYKPETNAGYQFGADTALTNL
jgi:hypothetical protein